MMRYSHVLRTATALAIGLSLCAAPSLAQETDPVPPHPAASILSTPSQTSDAATQASPTLAGAPDILSCPFEALRAAYLSLYEDTDALNVAALESEVFTVCIARQKQIKQLLDNEERLRAQLGDLGAAPLSEALVQLPAPAPNSRTDSGTEIAEEIAPETPTPTPPETFHETRAGELGRSALSHCTDRYTSGPVFGSAMLKGGLHAVVFDATRGTRLTVKSGDRLPGGLIIAEITTKDGVMVMEDGTGQGAAANVKRPLAQALAAPAFDDGGGLLFKTISLADVYTPETPEARTLDSIWEALE